VELGDRFLVSGSMSQGAGQGFLMEKGQVMGFVKGLKG